MSTKKRSWEKAVTFVRELEAVSEGRAPAVSRAVEPKTVADAVTAYLDDARSRHLAAVTVQKLKHWFDAQLIDWCKSHRVKFIRDLDLNRLREWRNSWTESAVVCRNKQSRLKSLMKFCKSSRWIADNPAEGLSRVKVSAVPTDYFLDEEFETILTACKKERNPARTRGLVLLMRWSGLAIMDACTLERERLDSDGRVFLYREKTGTPVHITLPPDVADELRKLSYDTTKASRYFFWSGKGTKKSATSLWHKTLKRVFERANLHRPDGTPKKCHPHMFRDTLSVNLLLCGVDITDVAKLLGHRSIAVTQKHYAPWVQARMERLDEAVKRTWAVTV
jgi:integrase